MTDSLSAGEIIYKAFVPTLKMALCIMAGFWLAKTGGLPSTSTKGISLVTMNISLPCLIFSSMVSAFTPQNITAFGPLVMMAIMYQLLGLLCTWVLREIVYVPRDFRWGMLVMGIISNWGNLPTAVVQTMAKEAPFDPTTDVDLGVAYIAIFVLVMNTTFFACGVHKVCGWDFMDDHIIDDPVPFKERWKRRQLRAKQLFTCITGRSKTTVTEVEEMEVPPNALEEERDEVTWDLDTRTISSQRALRVGPGVTTLKPRARSFTAMVDSTHRIPPTTPLDGTVDPIMPSSAVEKGRIASYPSQDQPYPLSSSPPPPSTTALKPRRSISTMALTLLKNIPPPTYAVVLGIIFSIVQPLKALLTTTTDWTGTRMPNAPDGNPPLNFILETTSFIGAMTVPMALILLGASFSRLKVPSRWRDLPLVAIVGMTCIKMIIVPIFAIFVVQALRDHTSIFPPAQKIRTFVAILLSGTPAAANQLVVTQLYNPAGTADTLASFLLLQYALMFVLSTALAALALYIADK